MTTIESDHKTVNVDKETLFNFLSDLNNYEQLVQSDKMSNWESTSESCSFKVMKAYTIAFEKNEVVPTDIIKLKNSEGSPFDFSLNAELKSEAEGSTTVYFKIEADLNPMLKMMASRPLKNLINMMVYRIEKLHTPA